MSMYIRLSTDEWRTHSNESLGGGMRVCARMQCRRAQTTMKQNRTDWWLNAGDIYEPTIIYLKRMQLQQQRQQQEKTQQQTKNNKIVIEKENWIEVWSGE